jgi:S-DNA-T family DNA segregation ATPase FtsK/SpoIIIE
MIEWLAFPLAIAGAAMIPKGKMTDEKKIKIIFENTRMVVKRGDQLQYPKLQQKSPQDTYTSYLYSLPLGIPSSEIEGIIPELKDGLNKEVEVEYRDGFYQNRCI